ncbi:ribonuclease kappa-like [Paramacrobiotus metropolitanus]|uniref:ribonuclease kappa-like n=1 Tax=Paramacrobiotus metropolitanus TaxID=2943436 RepID=UPI002445E80E|nr:ribonuclease kappa-like [Paramacrobiotus metropolitanus]
MIKLCGPKLAVTGLIISIWGIFQLVLMGVFFFVRSPALVEDLPLNETQYVHFQISGQGVKIDEAYKQQAYNCWVAAVLYAGLMIFSAQQLFMNLRQTTYTGM